LLYAAACAFALTPIAWMFIGSVRPDPTVALSWDELTRFTLAHFEELFFRTDFPRLFANSLMVMALTVIVTLAMSVSGAYALSRFRFRGRAVLVVAFLLTQMIPSILLLVPLYVMLQAAGLLDSLFGLSLGYVAFSVPVAVWLMKGYFDAIPIALEEAARVDGASRLGAILHVIIPLSWPGIAATAIFVAITSWNEFLFAALFTSGTDSRTWPVGMQLFIGEFELKWGVLTAGGVLSTLPVLVFFVLIQRRLVDGLAGRGGGVVG